MDDVRAVRFRALWFVVSVGARESCRALDLESRLHRHRDTRRRTSAVPVDGIRLMLMARVPL